jgi:hypothetical protein
MAEPNIHDYPWLLEELGIDVNALGAVMLPVKFREGYLERGYQMGILLEDDLVTDPSKFWIKGDVTDNAHVTLLYGLLEPGTEPAQAARIKRLLEDWRAPSWLPITGFEAFPPTQDAEVPYSCIVARIGDRNGALAEAHGRLEYLPHVNTFPEWKLHATIAYVQPHAEARWLTYLERGPRAVEVPEGYELNLGSDRPSGRTRPSRRD